MAELTRWYEQLREILDASADAVRELGVTRASVGLSDGIEGASAGNAAALLKRIDALVRDANARACRIGASDPALHDVVHPLLGVPGEPPEVDLRPLWSRLLQRVSVTARRGTAVEQLETLRLEADAALLRVTPRLARG